MMRLHSSKFSSASCMSRCARRCTVSSVGLFSSSLSSSENMTEPSSRTAETMAWRRFIRTPRAQRASGSIPTVTSRRPAPPPGMGPPSRTRPSAIISPTILVIAAGVSLVLSARRLRDMLPFSCRSRSAALLFVRFMPIILSPS